MKRTEPSIHLILRVPTLAEYFDHQKLFEILVRRYGGHSASSSLTAAGKPKSFTFSCKIPKSKATQFRAEWKRRTLDLSAAQKERLSVPIIRMFYQLHDQLGDDDFNLLIRTFRRPATNVWLISCAASEAKTRRDKQAPATPLASGHAVATAGSSKGVTYD